MECASDERPSFFFSSRRRHTRLQGDWSSDVCSSDLSLSARSALGPEGRGFKSRRPDLPKNQLGKNFRPHPSLAAEFPLSNLSPAVRITRLSPGWRGP